MWEARPHSVPSGLRFDVLGAGTPLPFREFFTLLETDADFVRWYSDTLSNCEFEAFFWELPPLTLESIESAAEFVLIESASLARLQPEADPFDAEFARHPDADVLSFPNLGGDALLIVPAPLGPAEAYPHLAAFLRNAPENQVRSLWRLAARTARKHLGDTPRWLSTAGLGVYWLHLRLDTRPKYYRYGPYRTVGRAWTETDHDAN